MKANPIALDPKRIAVVRALHLGDLLLAVPALRALRHRYPHAEITLVGLPWAREFVRRFSHYLDRHREFPGYPGLLEVDQDQERTRRFLEEERRYGYDLVIQMHGNGRFSNSFALALGGRYTVGYTVGDSCGGLDCFATYPDDQHEIDRNLGVIRLLEIVTDDRSLEFPELTDDRENLAGAIDLDRLDETRPIVGLHVGARPPARRWPAERFARVGLALRDRFGARIVVTAGPQDQEVAMADLVTRTVGESVWNLAGKTTIGGLASLIRRLDLFISNDTGPAHVASAVDTPSITIFGPADRRRWAPRDSRRHPIVFHQVACSPCPHWECPIDHRCLQRIAADDVLAMASQLLTSEATA